MAVTGVFLRVFPVVHLLGNMQLCFWLPEAQLSFNRYAECLSGLLVIRLAAYVTYLCIVVHSSLAVVLAVKNRAAGEGSAGRDPQASSPWYPRAMAMPSPV